MVGWVRSFETKEAFIEHCQKEEAYKKYASDIWDKCHLADELKPAEKLPEQSESNQENVPETTEIKKVATKRKSENKKE